MSAAALDAVVTLETLRKTRAYRYMYAELIREFPQQPADVIEAACLGALAQSLHDPKIRREVCECIDLTATGDLPAA